MSRRMEAAVTYEEWTKAISREMPDQSEEDPRPTNKILELLFEEMEEEEVTLSRPRAR